MSLINPSALPAEVRRELASLRSALAATTCSVCTSTTRPADPALGRMIFETDTQNLRVWDGDSWQAVVGVWA